MLSDIEIDQIFNECKRKKSVAKKQSLVIFYPIYDHNLIKVLNNIKKWKTDNYLPCKFKKESHIKVEPLKTSVSLFFLFMKKNINKTSSINLINNEFLNVSGLEYNIGKCFNHIIYKSFEEIGLNQSISKSDLLYKVFFNNIFHDYSHMLFIDDTTKLIKSNWINYVYEKMKSEYFWILGSMILSRVNDHFNHDLYSIQMNALYNVDDDCFKMFLKRVKEDIPEKPFHIAINEYRSDYSNFRIAQHTQHLFRYSRLFAAVKLQTSKVPLIMLNNTCFLTNVTF